MGDEAQHLLTRRAALVAAAGTRVKLRPPGRAAVRGRLVAVEDLAGESVRHLAGSQHACALRLRAPRGLRLGQEIVGIRHRRFGVVRLFVTPSATTARHQGFVAIVNRVRG